MEKCANKRAISCSKPATEETHIQLLQEADQWLGTWVVGDGSVHIDSIGGLRQTIRGVQSVWKKCKDAGCDFLCTRRLNQDALENLFGVIRQRGGDMDNPDPTQFRYAYKHTVLNAMMTAPNTANCEADGDGLLAALKEVASCTEPSHRPTPAPNGTPPSTRRAPVDPITENCIGYVAGYLVHSADVHCSGCTAVLVKGSNVASMASETLAALKSHTSLTSLDVGSLKLPTPAYAAFVTECYAAFNELAPSMILDSGLCEKLVKGMLGSKQAEVLQSVLCHPSVLVTIAATYTRLMLHSLCGRMTRERAVRAPSRQSKKLQKLQHR